MPVEERRIVRHGQINFKQVPIFGRYIFVLICKLWERVIDLRGIGGILLNKETMFPQQVAPWQLEAVKSLCDGNVMKAKDIPIANSLMRGDRVTPKTGPFVGFVGRYEGEFENEECATFELFGRENTLFFAKGELTKTAVADLKRSGGRHKSWKAA